MNSLLHNDLSGYFALLAFSAATVVHFYHNSNLWRGFLLISIGLLISIIAERVPMPSLATAVLEYFSFAVMLAGLFVWWKQLAWSKNSQQKRNNL